MTRKRFVKKNDGSRLEPERRQQAGLSVPKRQDGRVSGRAEGCHGRGIAAAGHSAAKGGYGMTVREVLARISEIDALCDLREENDFREGNIDMAVDILKEYRQVLLERKVVG